ncbi:leucyl aminopeptidase [Azospirillum doebereinerae]|uniref:Probable cytosol aminopeptidase n=1 Tax=Azospirillum doebereinerae TaxID=92933 RepID=A0A3S0XC43_9PROT|nr:leucyl aminopeptidase [Azospirillum doebereinerae]MCG5241117.1 leucyl aminopeptidase [Azospirillum doebereinerae]RUQ72883.1 leucyl aminopeptidase [Azospirillum doebereinerae]
MKFSFAKPSLPSSGIVAVTVAAERGLGALGQSLDQKTGGALTRAMAAARYNGKKDETLTLLAPAGVELERILLVGVGKAEEITDLALQSAGGTLFAALDKAADKASVLVDLPANAALSGAKAAAEIAFGARLRSYKFDKYKTNDKKADKKDPKPSLRKLTLLVEEADAAETAFATLDGLADAVFFARDLVSEPANVIYPETLADRTKALAEYGVEVEILDPKKLRKIGMGALLGVAQGSAQEARVVVMRYNGNGDAEDQRPVAFIGKGVTFDTGGISIKGAGGMEDMKWDMGGSATVIGTMYALAARKAKVNAVGIVGLVENMPSGTAQRPGDIVTSLSGQTIEVINTDAEGRLVLADCLWYAQDVFKPKLMIDLATLTGAIITALGHEHAGLFSNDDDLAMNLTAAGLKVGQPVWRLPMNDAYDKEIETPAADMKNVGSGGGAGSIVGAQFLKRFVNDLPWAHIDIAGVAWAKKDSATVPKGATAFGVRLLDRFVADFHEG